MPHTIFFDVETGGLEPQHPTIQLAAVAVDDRSGAEAATFNRLIRFNESDADPEALKLNHYDRERWQKEAIPPGAVAAQFGKFSEPFRCIAMISKRTANPYNVGKLAGHNALTFDLPRLRDLFGSTFFPFSYHVKDTLQRALWYFDEHPEVARPASLKLSVLCEHFGIACDDAHDALADVRMAAKLARAFSNGGK